MKEAFQSVEAAIDIAKKRGITTQGEFAQKLGIYATHLTNLKHDRPISPRLMGRVLEVLKPNDDELNQIVNPWSHYLQESGGYGHHVGTKSSIDRGLRKRRIATTALGIWLDKTASEFKVSLPTLTKKLYLGEGTINRYRTKAFSVEHMLDVLTPLVLTSSILNEDQKAQFVEAVAQTIESLAKENKLSQHTRNVGKKIQENLACKTYTGGQAAEKLKVTRQAIHQRKIKAGIKHKLLSEADILRIS